MSLAYYSEHDPYAAHWLRNLIAAGHIAPGVVDERDIRDVRPEELIGFTQVHMFAGIGVWSYALRSAGWSDDRPIWTGSCPCQPFSAAGRAGGFADERHLWPHWHWLIEQCRPSIVVGEQVASKDGLGWFDLVSADLEGSGYAVGASDLCAAGIGVDWQASQSGEWLRRAIHDCVDPVVRSMLCDFADWAGEGNISEGGNHIRQRLYFVGLADSASSRSLPGSQSGVYRGEESGRSWDGQSERSGSIERLADPMHAGRPEQGTGAGSGQTAGLRAVGGMDDDDDTRSQGHAGHGGAARREGSGRPIAAPSVSVGLVDADRRRTASIAGNDSEAGEETTRGTRPDDGSALRQRTGGIERLADGECVGRLGWPDSEKPASHDTTERGEGLPDLERRGEHGGTDAPDGRRYAKDWLFCRDDRWRAVEPRTFPLAHGITARVGKLRAFGNALDAETATRFCEVVKEICDA